MLQISHLINYHLPKNPEAKSSNKADSYARNKVILFKALLSAIFSNILLN